MKKVLFFLFLLIPFMVNAEVKITSVELESKSEGFEVDEHPLFNGLKINFDITFQNVGEYVEYKVNIYNDTKNDYEIENGVNNSTSEYTKYESRYEGDNNVIKAGENKIVYVKASYTKEVPVTEFTNGTIYEEKKDITIDLSNSENKNPQTNTSNYVIFITAIILFISLIITLITKHKLHGLSFFLISSAIIIPISIYALEKITIEVEANVKIESAFQEVHFFTCEWGQHASNNSNYGNDKHIIEKTYIARKTMSMHDVFNNPEWYTLNPNYKKFDWNWDIDGYILPYEFLDCINEVEYIDWYDGITSEDQAKYDNYFEHFYTCLNKDYDIAEQYGKDSDFAKNNTLIPKGKAIYFYNECIFQY